MASEAVKKWLRSGHIPVLICLQIIFIALFARYVVYDPNTAQWHAKSVDEASDLMNGYPSKIFIVILIYTTRKKEPVPISGTAVWAVLASLWLF